MKNFILVVFLSLANLINGSSGGVSFDKISSLLGTCCPDSNKSEKLKALRLILRLGDLEIYQRYSFAINVIPGSWEFEDYLGLKEMVELKSNDKEIKAILASIRFSILSAAALKRDSKLVSKMFDLGLKVSAVMLDKAISDKELFPILNSNGALNRAFLPDGQTLLTDAILKEDEKRISQLVGLGAKFDAMNQHQLFPLEVALYNQKFDIAELLVKLGANPDQVDSDGLNLLSRYGIHPKVKDDNIPAFFKLHGANVDTKSVADQIAGPILRSLGVNDDQLSGVLHRVFQLVKMERVPTDAKIKISFAAPSANSSNQGGNR